MEDFGTFLRRFEEANTAFVNGDPSLWMPLVSRSEHTSIFGGFGGQEVGWSEIGPRYEWAASQFRDLGGTVEFEYLDKHVGTDTAYTVAIERCTVQHVTQPAPVPHELRATMIFRLEDNEWKITHRHADPLTPRSSPSGP
ncbi:nuclear transport factor 2 family protein [Kribbella sp. HUAS MG21]|uniref:Nuclear transport factor 2 family protein n=1 Tax=Kribbella sp. HUAS MG21 TaxID=3160966 RepID=A0AAU7TC06_9ACTN